MMSISIWIRTGISGIALCVAGPVVAQDLRDIPQKTNTSVTGPNSQVRVQTKQGGQVQGPPAPLETQLRDTPPDDLIAPQQSQPRPQVQSQPVQARSDQPQPKAAAPRSQTRQQTDAPTLTPATLRQTPPVERAPTASVTSAPPLPASVSADQNNEPVAPPAADSPSLVEPSAQAGAEPSYLPSTGAASSGMAQAEAIPADEGPLWPWALGGLIVVGLGGAFMMRRRPATAGGFELGQTPWRDELDKEAPLPDITVAKPVGRRLPDVKIPQAPISVAPTPAPVTGAAIPVAPPPPPPEPAKATVNESGLIVSRVRRPVEMEPGGSVMAEPMQAPPPAPPPPQPAEARVANDGRIVSGRRASEFGAPPPEPKRKRPRKELPGGGMSFGYKVQR